MCCTLTRCVTHKLSLTAVIFYNGLGPECNTRSKQCLAMNVQNIHTVKVAAETGLFDMMEAHAGARMVAINQAPLLEYHDARLGYQDER